MGWFERWNKRKSPGDRNVRSAEALELETLLVTAPRFKPGDRFADVYEIKKEIAQGSMGTVYLAHHDGWGIDVAVKVPHAEILADPDIRRRIVREAETWTGLGMHPHIAYCYHVRTRNDVPLIVIEYLDGGNLRRWIEDGLCTELRTGLDLAIQFCHGLEHAHAHGFVHRDIKPENVLLTEEGTLKLTDFGIVRRTLREEATTGIVDRGAMSADATTPLTMEVGTPAYMAPEQWSRGSAAVDCRTDIFGFGVCLYEVFCGQRPYETTAGAPEEAPSPQLLRGDEVLPNPLCELLKRCVAWEQEDRPDSAQEVREEMCVIYRVNRPGIAGDFVS